MVTHDFAVGDRDARRDSESSVTNDDDDMSEEEKEEDRRSRWRREIEDEKEAERVRANAAFNRWMTYLDERSRPDAVSKPTPEPQPRTPYTGR